MRDLMMLAMAVVIVPLALRNAFSAYLLWGWAGVIALDSMAYGFMQNAKPVMTFAVITLLLFLLGRDPERQPLKLTGISLLYFCFGLQGLVAATFGYPSLTRNWGLFSELVKSLIFVLLMPALVTSRLRVHALVLALALSAGFYGFIEGLKFIATGGVHVSQGIANLGDRNSFAVAITMALPLLLYLVWYSKSKLVRLAALAAGFVNVLAVVSTQSRGGLLALAAAGAMLILRSKRKISGLVLVSVAVAMVLQVAPAEWSDRMNSMKSADQDSSFMGRVTAWKRATAIAAANPLTGGGFRSVQDPVVFEQFKFDPGLMGFIDTPIPNYPVAAHSIFFEVLSDQGFIGLGLFMAIVFSPLFLLSKVNRMCQVIGPSYRWAVDLMSMLNIAIVAYLVGGSLISAAYFEMAHMLIMLSFVLTRLVTLEHDRALGRPAAVVKRP